MYATILTVVCGVLLAVASEGLKPLQQANIELEQKESILSSVFTLEKGDDVAAIYEQRVKSYVVDAKGNVVDGKKVEEVDVVEEYKKPVEQRLLPVYEIVSENDPNVIDSYVLPLRGYGLWNNIWGFIALDKDLNTVKGVRFEHAGETPGLGARIATEEVQQRYVGKKIADGSQIVAVQMMKGEGNDYSDSPHKVDGMSGATITAKGLNNMLTEYLKAYESFFKSKSSNKQAVNLNK
ncbi:NADH:ubiquinone reductase (Na(+)-transporting) subunit C [Rhodocytophaga aerolata]